MRTLTQDEVTLVIKDQSLQADLTVPENAAGTIIFAHGSGSSRFSRRNRQVAATLNDCGFATLLMDLLTSQEQREDETTAALRFDIHLLSERLTGAIDWALLEDSIGRLPFGLFGASTGAAAAIVAAANRPLAVRAVVSRGGRPDLAGDALRRLQAPTLLLVGGDDEPVIELNKRAADHMKAEHQLKIIPGATHLFEEQGKLEEVARLAGQWFESYLGQARKPKASS